MNILITGGGGFIGNALCEKLSSEGHNVRATVRTLDNKLKHDCCDLIAIDLMQHDGWQDALSGVGVIIHAAGMSHAISGGAKDSLSQLLAVNADATINLARQAVKANVQRFIFISTIKVNGDFTESGQSFKYSDNPNPTDSYAISKYHAELGLMRIAKETGLEVVIIRPPIVYGPNVKGNFLELISHLKKGIPLPFGAITSNRRSMVALDNLVDLVDTCINNPLAANKIFLVSDNDDLSTSDLMKRLGKAIDKPTRLLSIPPVILLILAKIFGRLDLAKRLLFDLRVDISSTCKILEWSPPISVDEGLRRMAIGIRDLGSS